MLVREVQKEEKAAFNLLASHPLQSWEWGQFREKMGQRVFRLGVFDPSTSSGQAKMISGYQILFTNIPKTPYSIGTLLKGPMPDKLMLDSLKKLCQQQNAIFIKIEPLVGGPVIQNGASTLKQQGYENVKKFLLDYGCREGKPLFTKYTFWLDLTKTENQLLEDMHPKTRYNLRLAQKYGVTVKEEVLPEMFTIHLKLLFETTKRQGFYAHTPEYHQQMWETLRPPKADSGQALTAHLLMARYKNQPLGTWVLFVFNKVLYYPYGGSSREFKEVMPSYAMMWEAIKFGKRAKCKTFDLWGTPGPNPSPSDPWFGFHRFKLGFSPQLVEFIGSYDLVMNNPLYTLYNSADKIRWIFLKTKAKITSII